MKWGAWRIDGDHIRRHCSCQSAGKKFKICQGKLVLVVGEKGGCAPIFWDSNKIARVDTDPLAAEILAMADAIEEGHFVTTILEEMFGLEEGCVDMAIIISNTPLIYDIFLLKNTANYSYFTHGLTNWDQIQEIWTKYEKFGPNMRNFHIWSKFFIFGPNFSYLVQIFHFWSKFLKFSYWSYN